MTRSKLIAVLGAVAGIVLAASTPALAQKSKDNLR
ncbi:MAG: hypothetical protein K0Q70_2455, partial [Rhodospirillales bacterium]|nr:hypothetical protein [Rhodospirillales bacterium]